MTSRPIPQVPTRTVPSEEPEEDEEEITQPTARPTSRPTQRPRRPTIVPLTIRTIPTLRPTLPSRPLITQRPFVTTTVSDEEEPETDAPRFVSTTQTPPVKGRPRPVITTRPRFQTIVTSRPTQPRTIPTRPPVTRVPTVASFDTEQPEDEELDVTTRPTVRPTSRPVTITSRLPTRPSLAPQTRPAPFPTVTSKVRTTTQAPLDEDDELIEEEPKRPQAQPQPRPQLQTQRPATRQPAITVPQFGQRISPSRPTTQVSGVKTQQPTFRPQPTTTRVPVVFEDDEEETDGPVSTLATPRPTIRTTTRVQTIRTRPASTVAPQSRIEEDDYEDQTVPPTVRPRPVQTSRPTLAPRPTLPAVRQPTRRPAPVVQTLPPIVQETDRRPPSSRPILPLQPPASPASPVDVSDEEDEKDEGESEITVPEFQPTRRPVISGQQGSRQPRPLDGLDLSTPRPQRRPLPPIQSQNLPADLPVQRPTSRPTKRVQVTLPRLPSGKQAIPRRPGSKSPTKDARLALYDPPLGRPQALSRPDKPLENGSMPECTLLGQNYCILTKDYPM